MKKLDVVKLGCNSVSVIAGGVSCFFWMKSAKAKVFLDEIPEGTDDIGFEEGDRHVAVVGTGKKQSGYSALGATFAAIATFFQIVSNGIDIWGQLLDPSSN